jgi:hypothetical protein
MCAILISEYVSTSNWSSTALETTCTVLGPAQRNCTACMPQLLVSYEGIVSSLTVYDLNIYPVNSSVTCWFDPDYVYDVRITEYTGLEQLLITAALLFIALVLAVGECCVLYLVCDCAIMQDSRKE